MYFVFSSTSVYYYTDKERNGGGLEEERLHLYANERHYEVVTTTSELLEGDMFSHFLLTENNSTNFSPLPVARPSAS